MSSTTTRRWPICICLVRPAQPWRLSVCLSKAGYLCSERLLPPWAPIVLPQIHMVGSGYVTHLGASSYISATLFQLPGPSVFRRGAMCESIDSDKNYDKNCN